MTNPSSPRRRSGSLFGRLLLLFVLVPVLELLLLIEIGRHVGTLPTLALIVVTGVVGAWLARRQGLGVLAKVRAETAAGRVPTGALVDGVLILVAAAVLMTPGVLTDAFGFFCLVPAGRRLIKRLVRKRFEAAVEQGRVRMDLGFGGRGGTGFSGSAGSPGMKNVTPEKAPEDKALDEPREPAD